MEIHYVVIETMALRWKTHTRIVEVVPSENVNQEGIINTRWVMHASPSRQEQIRTLCL